MNIASPRAPLALLLGAVLLTAGCTAQAPPLKTYAVKGVVKYKDGQPFTDGSIYFRPVKDGGNPATGEVDAQGQFTLHTFQGNTKLPGAQDGTYQVMVMAKMDANQSGGWSVNLPAPLTVKPSDDNEFTITLDRPRK